MEYDKLDIYFRPKYGKLFESVDGGKLDCITVEHQYGQIYYQFLLRPIDGEYYDIVTPYGYGGPIVINCLENKKPELLRIFHAELMRYCDEHRVVSELIRFSPWLNNQQDFTTLYSIEFNRNTVAVDLTDANFFENQFTSKCRNQVRKAQKNDVIVEFDFEGNSVDDFWYIYMETMSKIQAADYYYFGRDFFIQTVKALYENIFIINAIWDGRIVSSAMFLHGPQYLHYHFSATLPEHYGLCANNLILHEAAKWGHENNKQLLHLGGGFSRDLSDSLLKFKRSFARNTDLVFSLGKRIHDHEVYNILVQQNKCISSKPNKSFFPLYRSV